MSARIVRAVACFLSLVALARADDACGTTALPPSAAQTLNSQVPGWKIAQLSELSPEHQQLWKTRHPEDCPGIVEGKFVPDVDKSFAVLLTEQENREQKLRVVLLVPIRRRRAAAGFRVVNVIPPSGAEGENVLKRVGPATYTGVEGKQVAISLDGIMLEQLESGSVLYYWHNGKFRSLLLSE